MIGLSLNDGHDLHVDATGNLATVRDADAAGQLVKQRLKTYRGEWFLDENVGVRWFSHQDRPLVGALDVPFNEIVAEGIIKQTILQTLGVTGINLFDMRVHRDRRELEVLRVEITTQFDETAEVTI